MGIQQNVQRPHIAKMGIYIKTNKLPMETAKQDQQPSIPNTLLLLSLLLCLLLLLLVLLLLLLVLLLLPLVVTSFSHLPVIVHRSLPFVVHVSLPALGLGLCPYSPALFVSVSDTLLGLQMRIILLTSKPTIINLNMKY